MIIKRDLKGRFVKWVLRLGTKGIKKKPLFKGIIGDLDKKYDSECSSAHFEGLKAIYGKTLPKVKYTNLDGNPLSKLFVTDTASK